MVRRLRVVLARNGPNLRTIRWVTLGSKHTQILKPFWETANCKTTYNLFQRLIEAPILEEIFSFRHFLFQNNKVCWLCGVEIQVSAGLRKVLWWMLSLFVMKTSLRKINAITFFVNACTSQKRNNSDLLPFSNGCVSFIIFLHFDKYDDSCSSNSNTSVPDALLQTPRRVLPVRARPP